MSNSFASEIGAQHHWRVVIDRGNGPDTTIHEGQDFDKVCLRIGQMALSFGIEQIIVYRDGEEYRRYVLSRGEIQSEDEYIDCYTDIHMTVVRYVPKVTVICPKDRTLSIEEINEAIGRLRQSAGISPTHLPDLVLGQVPTETIRMCSAPKCECNHPCDDYLEHQADMLSKDPDPFGVGHTTID